MAGDRATLGKTIPKGCDVRRLTGDSVGGTTLVQNTGVLWRNYHIPMVASFYAGFGDLLDSLSEGRGVVVQIGYRPIRDSAFRGSESFTGGHAVYVNEYDAASGRVLVYDPLADGRRAGIAQGPDWWPAILLKVAAGELQVGSGNKVGFGKAWYAYTRVTAAVAHQKPLVTVDYGRQNVIAAIEGFSRSAYVMALAKSQTIYREPRTGAKGLTRMSKAVAVPVIGNAASGWKAVVVRTAGGYSDGIARPTVAYVPASAGEVTAR